MLEKKTVIQSTGLQNHFAPGALRDQREAMSRVFFADDDDDNSLLMIEILQALGHEARRAKNGQELLEFVAAQTPDLVLLDIEMPVLDGAATVRRLREDERFRNLPILAITATAVQGDRERLQKAGFTDYLSKPFKIPEFARLLSRYLR